MRLNDYLTKSGMTKSTFATQIGTTVATVSRISDGLVVPRRELLRRIHEVTNGQVTPNDVVGLYRGDNCTSEEEQ